MINVIQIKFIKVNKIEYKNQKLNRIELSKFKQTKWIKVQVIKNILV